MRRDNKGLIYTALYADDNLLVSTQEAIDDTIEQLQAQGLVLKIKDELDDYLSCDS